MPEFVIQIDFTDRKGLGYEIFQLFEDHGCDKVFMEVAPGHGMLIKFRSTSSQTGEALMADIRKLPGVNSVGTRSQMAYEDRENELRTILNSVDEGIIAVNGRGKITHLNDSASKILGQRRDASVGRPVHELFRSDGHHSTDLNDPSMDVNAPPRDFTDHSMNLTDPSHAVKTVLNTGLTLSFKAGQIRCQGRIIRFLGSYVPILNDSRQVIGAVITLKGEHQIREIISSFNGDRHPTSFTDIVYQSEKMNRVVETAKVVARGIATVLLRGESGTGKELFARSIHTESPRRNKPFIAINCSAIPSSLLESELFGYEGGAFTGALKNGKAGLFEQAHQGTLFLDEVGELSLPMQAQLLRVLQDGTIRRVGGNREIVVDVRIVAATHRNLESMMETGAFREDLYYRLNVIPLRIPALRERPEDISVIAEFLLNKITVKMQRPPVHLTKQSLRVLERQEWTGNVRQLENVLERIMNVLPETEEITPENLYEWTDVAAVASESTDAQDQVQITVPLHEGWPTLHDIVAAVEKQVLSRVLEEHPSSRKAGNILGVSNTTIINKVRMYDIPYPK